MAYLQRLSGLLRLGEPVRDVLLYLPTTDAYARLGTATTLDLWRTLAGMIDPRVIASLRTAGYDLALLDDGLAARVEPPPTSSWCCPVTSPCPPRPEPGWTGGGSGRTGAHRRRRRRRGDRGRSAPRPD